jgi:hypothetical protein
MGKESVCTRRRATPREAQKRLALLRLDLQVLDKQLGYLLGGTAIPRLDLAQCGDRAAYKMGKLFLRQVERLPSRLEPYTKWDFVIRSHGTSNA